MDTTIRNLDEGAYRRAKARAAIDGKNIGEVISEALFAYTREGPAARNEAPAAPLPRPKGRAPAPRAGTFVRPFPKWGPFVDNPMVVVELKEG